MNKPLDLPDVTLGKAAVGMLVVTHKKTGMETLLSVERLNAWLLRQLRQELISTKDIK
jgi:hypothetical protein